jgi:Icc-related predicted phosphoesterase
MKILALSDTHSKHRKVEIDSTGIDVLLHCGDITAQGEIHVLKDFANWLKDLPIPHKNVICGNHELGYEFGYKRPEMLKIFEDAGINYLENSEIVIDGIKFYGSPVTPFFHDWEWNYQRGEQIKKFWDKIPDDTNVLMTHGPPYGIVDLVEDDIFNKGRDLHQGCEELAKRVKQLKKLKLSCHGHLHHSASKIEVINGTTFANVAIMNDRYLPVNKPQIFEI